MEVMKKAHETEMLSHETEISRLREELAGYRKGAVISQPTNAMGARPLPSKGTFAPKKHSTQHESWSLLEFFFGAKHHIDDFEEILHV